MPGRPSPWPYALRRTIHVLLVERVADVAATLAFFAVLSLFPGLLAVFGIFGLVGQGRRTATAIMSYVGHVAPPELLAPFRSTIEHLAGVGGASAGLGTALALMVALWTASRYVSAFSWALNRVYNVQEGRRFWKRRLLQLAITIAIVVLTTLVLFVLVFSGPLFGPHGIVNLGDVMLAVWSVGRWVIAAAAMVVVIVLLYWGTPNIRQPRLRWMTEGGVTALVLMGAASAGFVLYVSRSSTYNREYGALAGLVVFLIWLWLMNLMLLFGAAFDVELERVRELRAGQDATRVIRLPLRDHAQIESQRRSDDRFAAQAMRFLPTGQQVGGDGQDPVEGSGDAQDRGNDPRAASGLVDDRRHT